MKETESERLERWKRESIPIFGDRPPREGDRLVAVEDLHLSGHRAVGTGGGSYYLTVTRELVPKGTGITYKGTRSGPGSDSWPERWYEADNGVRGTLTGKVSELLAVESEYEAKGWGEVE